MRAIVFLSAIAMGTMPALADDAFPTRAVEVVIPFAQGGGTDQVGRALAEYMKVHLGEDMYASNREGGSGAIGFRYGADATADGHVVTMLVTTLTTAPHSIEGYPVTYADFEPICLISAPPVVLSVRTGGPYETLEDLVEAAKASDRTLTFGTAGPGSNTHLAGVAFTQAAGIEGRFVPHSGSAPVLTATYGGHIDVALSEVTEARPWSVDGRLKVLAIFDETAVEGIEAPTAKELGYDVQVGAFRGIGVPRGTPETAVSTLIEACRATTEDAAFQQHMERLNIEVDPLFGEDFGNWLEGQHNTFAAAAEAAGL